MAFNTSDIRCLKGKRPIVALTAYDAITATWADKVADLILVGDSLGSTALGYTSTVPVTLKTMRHHALAVMRAQVEALVVVDMPFGCSGKNASCLLSDCVKILQATAVGAVKIEGGRAIADKVALLTETGVPVLGHVGLLPQRILQLGTYRLFGKTQEEADSLKKDILALQQAGVFAIVVECVDSELSETLASISEVPLIGIGAGQVDGQIRVISDVLGMHKGHYPAFVEIETRLAAEAQTALERYSEKVKAGGK